MLYKNSFNTDPKKVAILDRDDYRQYLKLLKRERQDMSNAEYTYYLETELQDRIYDSMRLRRDIDELCMKVYVNRNIETKLIEVEKELVREKNKIFIKKI